MHKIVFYINLLALVYDVINEFHAMMFTIILNIICTSNYLMIS